MRLGSLFPKLGFMIAVFPSNNHISEKQQRRTSLDGVSISGIASTTSPPPPTPTPSPPNLAARTNGFTDPLIPTPPTIFYETATAFKIISGVTVFTTYTDLIVGTVAIPFTGGTELNLSALPTTSAIATSLVFPVEPTIPPGSATPTLDLSTCSTAAGDGVQACENSLIRSFNSAYGAQTTSSIGSGSGTGSGIIRVNATPTTTVTEPYLGAEIAKGEATWAVGGQRNGAMRRIGGVKRNMCSVLAGLGGMVLVGVFW